MHTHLIVIPCTSLSKSNHKSLFSTVFFFQFVIFHFFIHSVIPKNGQKKCKTFFRQKKKNKTKKKKKEQ